MLNSGIYNHILKKLTTYLDIEQFRDATDLVEPYDLWDKRDVHQRLDILNLNPIEFCMYRINKRLANMRIYGLVEAMIEGKAIMAGSFPLQCFLGEEWEDSDIDIFLIDNRTDETSWDKLLKDDKASDHDKKMFYQEVETRMLSNTRNTELYINHNITNPLDRFVAMNSDFKRKGEHYLDTKFKIWEYLFDGCYKVQVIYGDPSTTVEDHIDDFDFSFCKIMYDGNTVKFDNLDDIINKQGYINNNMRNVEQRIINAKNRTQFLQMPPFNIKNHLEELMKYGLNKRYKKYKERGFTFLNEDQFLDMLDME